MQQVRADLESGKPSVRKTGLSAFDRAFGGVPVSGVLTILGTPGSGKTSLALSIAREIATYHSDEVNCGVLLFSYEMSAHAIALNSASALGQFNFSAIARGLGQFGEREKRKMDAAVHLASRMHLDIVDASVTPNEIYRRVAVGVRNGVRAIVVDYVQNLPSDDPRADDVRRIESACRIMQRVARDHGVLVILVSQMDKASTQSKEPPRASDGKGSGAIREVSDMMIGVFRPALWETPTDFESGEGCSDWTERKQYVELEVLKNKQGPLGTACVRFLPEWTAFEDREDASVPT
jgi:replicative DNA helicase